MRPEYATVVDVIQGKGVKIKKDGEKEALDIYYNNLGAVNVGDKVYIKYTSGSILVVGKVHSGNTDTGGGSSTGVTKEYVDTQDAELSRQINVLSGKIDIGILRSGTLAEYILKHGRNGGVGGNTYEASMTDLPEQRWGMFHVMKHASEVWTVIWYSDYNSTHYKRQLRSEGWVTEWEPIATTSKTDILFSGDFSVEETQTITLSKPITTYNRLYLNTGQGGAKTWCEIIVNCSHFPNNFRVNDIITFIVPNTSYQPTCVSLKMLSETQLQVIGGSGVRLRNLKGVVAC